MYYKHGLLLLNELQRIKFAVDKVIVLTRDPIVSCCSYVLKDSMEINESFLYWTDVNTILWYFVQGINSCDRYFLKYEDILTKNHSLVSIFDFLHISFNSQYLHYGDFDQFTFTNESLKKGYIDCEKIDCYDQSKVQQLSKTWKNWRNKPIVAELGYSREIDI